MWLLIGCEASFSGDTFNATCMITYACVYMSKTYLLERPISCLSGAYKLLIRARSFNGVPVTVANIVSIGSDAP